MKYLKLFEDHKETSDKISKIQAEADDKIKVAIEEYKSMIDQFMFDITDDYDTTSEIGTVDIDRSLDRVTKTYVHYTIQFKSDEYEAFLSKLQEVTERLIESENITYYISRVFAILSDGEKTIPGRFSNLRHPFDIYECKTKIRNYIPLFNSEDVNLKLKISF
jgi:hypothetical protein